MKNTLSLVLILSLSSATCLQAQEVKENITPQQNLPKTTLFLNGHTLNVQIATDNISRNKGFMGDTNISTDEGMLFVMDHPQRACFWMKNTPAPLSVAYINKTGRILEIHDLKPFDETTVLSASDFICYAIETPQGWFYKNKVLAGDRVEGITSSTNYKK